MLPPLIRDLAGGGTPVAVTGGTSPCGGAGAGRLRTGFLRWRVCPVTDRDWSEAHLINAAADVHHHDPEFGYRSIADELQQQGVTASPACAVAAASAAPASGSKGGHGPAVLLAVVIGDRSRSSGAVRVPSLSVPGPAGRGQPLHSG